MKKPYYERVLSESTAIRGFSHAVHQSELVWHRDRENRTIIVVEGTGWKFQRDNCLPELLSEGNRVSVSAGEYHRLVKGDSDLIVTIIKEKKSKKNVGLRSLPADGNPEVTKMDFLPQKVIDKIAKEKSLDEKETVYPSGYSAPEGSKRNKDLDRCTKLYKDGKTKEAAACRKKMEKPHMKESLTLTKEVLDILVNDTIEEEKLDMFLNEIEEKLDEKKRKKRKKRKKSKGAGKLSKAVKKSLDKKADRRCLTRGSVYSEFRKGLAAFLSSGSRKGMSAHQWAHARVNSANPSKSWATVKKRKTCPKKKKKK